MGDVDNGANGSELSWLARGACAGFFTFMAAWLSPLVPVAPKLGFALGFASLFGLALWVAAAGRGGRFGVWVAALSMLLLALLWLTRLRTPWMAPVVGSALLWAGTFVGMALGRRIEHAGHLLFVAWVSAVVDAVSVLHPRGVSYAISQSEAALSVLALPFPLLGTADTVPMLGVGDVVFTALYVAATRRHGLPLARTVAGLVLGLTLTLTALLWLEVTVPALPLLGLGVIVMQPAARRPPQEQRVAAVALASVLSVVAALFLLGTDR